MSVAKRSLGCLLAAAWAAVATPAFAATADGVLDLLRPGSRPSLACAGTDPFLSPLEDQAGWWSRMALEGGAVSRVESRFSDPVGADELGTARVRGREVSWRTTAEGRRLGMPWRWSAHVREPSDFVGFRATSGTVTIDQGGSAADLGVRVSPRPWLTLQGTVPIWERPAGAIRSDGGAGLRWVPHRRVALQGSWERARVPDELASNVRGTPLAASLNLELERLRFDGRTRPVPGLAVEVSAIRTRSQGIEDRTSAPVYRIDPRGASTMEQASVYWGGSARTRLLLRWTHSEADVAADLLWTGQRFGQVNYGRARLRSYLAAVEAFRAGGARGLLDCEWVRAEVTARGEAESWPFTATLVDLMGLRRIYKATAEAEWLRGHVGFEHRLGKAMRMTEGVEWIDAFPRARLESWSPAVFVFGMADRQEDRLNVRRLQLALLSLGWSVRLGSTGIDAGLEQFIFARTFKEERVAEPAESASSLESLAPRHAAAGIPGVTRIRFALSRAF